MFIYQNVLSRCLTTLAFGVGHGRHGGVACQKAGRGHERLDPLDAGQNLSALFGKVIRIDSESGATPSTSDVC